MKINLLTTDIAEHGKQWYNVHILAINAIKGVTVFVLFMEIFIDTALNCVCYFFLMIRWVIGRVPFNYVYIKDLSVNKKLSHRSI